MERGQSRGPWSNWKKINYVTIIIEVDVRMLGFLKVQGDRLDPTQIQSWQLLSKRPQSTTPKQLCVVGLSLSMVFVSICSHLLFKFWIRIEPLVLLMRVLFSLYMSKLCMRFLVFTFYPCSTFETFWIFVPGIVLFQWVWNFENCKFFWSFSDELALEAQGKNMTHCLLGDEVVA